MIIVTVIRYVKCNGCYIIIGVAFIQKTSAHELCDCFKAGGGGAGGGGGVAEVKFEVKVTRTVY